MSSFKETAKKQTMEIIFSLPKQITLKLRCFPVLLSNLINLFFATPLAFALIVK